MAGWNSPGRNNLYQAEANMAAAAKKTTRTKKQVKTSARAKASAKAPADSVRKRKPKTASAITKGEPEGALKLQKMLQEQPYSLLLALISQTIVTSSLSLKLDKVLVGSSL